LATSDPLPAELALLALAGRFVEAEAQIRALVRRAPTGDRRRLLAEGLAILQALRAEVTAAALGGTLAAYAVAALAAQLLTGRPAPDSDRAHGLGRGLALGLTRAIVSVEERSQRVFRSVTADTLEARGLIDLFEATAALGVTDVAGEGAHLAHWSATGSTSAPRSSAVRQANV